MTPVRDRVFPRSPEDGGKSGLGEKRASGRMESIPIIDLGPYLAGRPGALDAAAAELRWAQETIGFFYIVNHGIDPDLRARAFAETRRFHAQPLDEKMKIHLNATNKGYMPLKGHAQRHSVLNKNPKPNENESFFCQREMSPEEVAAKAGQPLGDPNQWPENLPGFRDTVLEYHTAMTALARKMLPVYARALDLPPDALNPIIAEGGKMTVRMIHYPPATQQHVDENVFGTAAHTDRSLFTVLAAGDTPGLQIMMPNGEWLEAAVMPEAFVVNAGDALRRWTNDRFLSTPHRVLNLSGRDRYSIAFFVGPDFDATIECLPTCTSADNPPKYPPVTFRDMYLEFLTANYANQQKKPDAGAMM